MADGPQDRRDRGYRDSRSHQHRAVRAPSCVTIRPTMTLRKLLRHDLAEARKTGDTESVTLLRTLIAAIENAEAVVPAEVGGRTEVPRRQLTDDDILRIVLNESDELRHAALEYDRRGVGEEAHRLRVLAEVADRYFRAAEEDRT